jgi:hypothetical protein
VTQPDRPDDLAALERELAARPRPAPSEALREHVLAAARRELTAPPAPGRRLGAWEFALAAAAAFILVLNLSISAANNMNWRLCGRLDRAAVASAAEEIGKLAPELPPQEVRREALILVAGSRLPMLPQVKTRPGEAPWTRPAAPTFQLPGATGSRP